MSDIRVISDKKRIVIDGKGYELIMCYLCPIEKEPEYAPITAYWLTNKEKVSASVVGKALGDSGFGGYRFFETVKGQGFEYDHEKDPRKRHGHTEERIYGGGFVTLWYPFIKLSPIFSINEFFFKVLGGAYGDYPSEWKFVSSDTIAIEFISKMRKMPPFKVVDDICKHGKPLFYLNYVAWENKVRYAMTKEKVKMLEEWFGIELMSKVNIKKEGDT